jgi:hypothetical protein
MNLLYPRFPLRQLPVILQTAAIGALVAGGYGMVHDQLSYSISSEYFTKMKFEQFAYADFGLPRRCYVSIIGFLATWGVGFIGGWLLGRFGLAAMPPTERRKRTVQAFAIVLGVAMIVGAIGLTLGTIVASGNGLSAWREYEEVLELQNLRGFVIVAYLHWAGYLGAAIGIVIAVSCVKRWSIHNVISPA